MRWVRPWLCLVAVGLLFALSALQQPHPAEADGTGWLAGNPSLRALGNIEPGQIKPNLPCNWMTVTVVNNILNTIVSNEESLCMVQTPEGLVDHSGKYIELNTMSKAYPIKNNAPGVSSLIPVPGQASAIAIHGDPSYPGSDLSLYKDLYSHLSFNVLTQNFSLTDQPDMTFSYANHRALPFNTASLAFSDDGNYLMGDVVFQGFVRINLNTLDIVPFASTLPRSTSNGLQAASVAIDSSGEYATIGYNGALGWGGVNFLKIVDINSCSGALASDQYGTTGFHCAQVEEYPFLSSQISDLKGIAGLSFASDHSLIVDTYLNSGRDERYMMTSFGQPSSLVQYLAMGDSYISGEGAFNYVVGTDTDTNKCHQSVVSYPYLIGKQFSSFASVACSGAVVDNVIRNAKDHNDYQTKPNDVIPSVEQENEALEEHIPGVVYQARFLQQDNPDVVTISIGGNDIGFSKILTRCVAPFNDFSSLSSNCYQTYEDRKELVNTINSKFNELYQTYTTLTNNAPNRRVYVIGYPQIISATGGCSLNVRLSQSDREFANQLISYLDSVIKRAAESAGVFYVDTQDALSGHELCQPTPAINGITEGDDDWKRLANESYHPNKFGYELLADTIAAKTHNLTDPMPAPDTSSKPPTTDDSLPILQAPKSNRAIYEVKDVSSDDLVLLNSVSSTNVQVDDFRSSLRPGSKFDVVLHSDPVNLGQVVVGGDGSIDAAVQVPAGTPAGYHTLHFYGKNFAGDPIDIQQLIYVEANAADYDGDGIMNATDSCPASQNSGTDYDQDGIDDVCDPTIGQPPATPAVSSGSISGKSQDDVTQQSVPSRGSLNVTTPVAETVTLAASPNAMFVSQSHAPVHHTKIGSKILGAAAAIHTLTTKKQGRKEIALTGGGLIALCLALLWLIERKQSARRYRVRG
jgi:lysophospholipase L1-like esterase